MRRTRRQVKSFHTEARAQVINQTIEGREFLQQCETACSEIVEKKLGDLEKTVLTEMDRKDQQHAKEVKHLLDVAEKLKQVYDEVLQKAQARSL